MATVLATWDTKAIYVTFPIVSHKDALAKSEVIVSWIPANVTAHLDTAGPFAKWMTLATTLAALMVVSASLAVTPTNVHALMAMMESFARCLLDVASNP